MTLAPSRTDVLLDPRTPSVRLARLLDPESAEPLTRPDATTVAAVRGRIAGAPVFAYCTDATQMGGSLSASDGDQISAAIDAAREARCPVIGLWHSGGARLAEGVESMEGVGRMFAAMTRASGVVPQISVVLGPAAGAAAYGPALTDLIVMSDSGRLFITGPDVVQSVTGEQIDMAGLGGPTAHGPRSGVAHVMADGEEEACRQARRLTEFFTRPGEIDLDALREPRDLRVLLPESPRRAYDVRPLITAIVEDFDELQASWAANIVIGFGRLGGRSVGLVASNPIRRGGCLDSLSAEKASRFVRLCDALGIPLIVIVDVPGYLPGVQQEWQGVVRRGAKLLHAFAASVVPRVTLITRKSYGGAYIAMNSRSLGATRVLSWPNAEVAVMGAEAAVGIIHRKRLAAADATELPALRERLVEEQRLTAGGVQRAMDIGAVDAVIAPETTRYQIGEALTQATWARGSHSNIPL